MRNKAIAFGLALLSPTLSAHAADCLHAPYGATQRQFETMIEGAATGAADFGLPPKVMVGMAKAELRMACAAKYRHAGLAHFTAIGISRRQIARESVAELAEADMAAENRRVKADSQPLAITVREFEIQGPRLAKTGATVSIAGVYVREGAMEYLFANSTDVTLAESPGYGAHVPRVALLTSDASDQARRAFLDCAQNPGSVYVGCPVNVSGAITECQESSTYGGTRELACLDVTGLSEENQALPSGMTPSPLPRLPSIPAPSASSFTPIEAVANDFPTVEDFYPRSAARKDEQGTALVKICIGPSGAVSQAPKIVKSSGHRSLDGAAVKYARATSGHWRPETRNGNAVASCTTLPVRFQLTDSF